MLLLIDFRYVFKYRGKGKQYRDLVKVFGLRFTLFVSGTAGRFSFIKLFLNIGSGLGLIAFVTYVIYINNTIYILVNKYVYK